MHRSFTHPRRAESALGRTMAEAETDMVVANMVSRIGAFVKVRASRTMVRVLGIGEGRKEARKHKQASVEESGWPAQRGGRRVTLSMQFFSCLARRARNP